MPDLRFWLAWIGTFLAVVALLAGAAAAQDWRERVRQSKRDRDV